MLLYIKRYEKDEEKFLSATDEEIVNYIMNNPGIVDCLNSRIEEEKYNKWLLEVIENYAYITGCSEEEAENEIKNCGESEVLFQNGMTVAEASVELSLTVGRSVNND